MKSAYDIPTLHVWDDPPPIHITAFKKALRNAWRDHFGNACQSCDAFMHFEIKFRTHARYATIDHIKARACGGGNTLKNLQVICRSCNNTKAKQEMLDAGVFEQENKTFCGVQELDEENR